MGTNTPVLDRRTFEDIYLQALELARHYCPELTIPNDTNYFDPGDPGLVILKLFSKRTDFLINQLNRIPEKHLLAFLDFAGIDLLPARPSKVPLTFYISEGSKSCAVVPAGTRVASSESPDVIFETTQGLGVMTAKLDVVFSLNPWEDKYTDHSTVFSGKEDGFFIFGRDNNEKLFDHALCLGDDTLFDIQRPPRELTVHLEGTNLSNEYFYHWSDGLGNIIKERVFSDVTFDNESRIEKLDIILTEKNNRKFERLGSSSIDGTKSFWLVTRPQEGLFHKGVKIPSISRISLDITVEDILPDGAFFNNMSIDVKKGFHPFGEVPKKSDTLYIGSEEAFSKETAQITFDIEPASQIENINVKLLWEHWDGSGWKNLNVTDNTSAFTKTGQVIIENCPSVLPIEINGLLNRWIRVRILSEDAYGAPEKFEMKNAGRIGLLFAKINESKGKIRNRTLAENVDDATAKPEQKKPAHIDRLISSKTRRTKRRILGQAKVRIIPRSVYGHSGIFKPKHISLIRRSIPDRITRVKKKIKGILRKNISDQSEEIPFVVPFIQSMGISYSYKETEPTRLKVLNNFQYDDMIMEEPEKPYHLSPDEMPALYLGFKDNIANIAITLFFAIKKAPYNEKPMIIKDPEHRKEHELAYESTGYVWEYYNGVSWEELTGEDETDSFRNNGIISFLVPPNIKKKSEYGMERYWLKARTKKGSLVRCPELTGIFPNTVWALNNITHEDEILGSGNGETNFTLGFSHKSLLEGQIIEIKEMDIPSKEELKTLENNDALRLVEEDGRIKEAWVRWDEVNNFAFSGPLSRHYVLNRAEGTITFGDGSRGMVPPKGMNNIIANYKSGGGKEGNVGKETIKLLKKTIPNIDNVTNHVSAFGGMDQENPKNTVNRGPYTIKSRGRVVTKEDFEWMALEASQDVARAACMMKDGTLWVVIIPESDSDVPLPDTDLLNSVKIYLKQRALMTISDRIKVIGPEYTKINIYVNVRPVFLEDNAIVSEKIEKRLRIFLHPLKGGLKGKGWDFGQAIVISQMAAVIEDIEGVDYVNEIMLSKITPGQNEEKATGIEQIAIEQNTLPCAGNIDIEIAG